MPATAILWPVAAHLALIGALYAWLTVGRWSAVFRGEVAASTYRTGEGEPLLTRLIANSLRNQFELPALFHVLAMTLYVTDDVSAVQLALAWVFAAGRWMHALAHVLSPVVLFRGAVFAVGFLAAGAMWVVFLVEKLAR